MTSGVPRQAMGVRREAIETARDAARRSGMSVAEWLDTVIAESASDAGPEPARYSHPNNRAGASDAPGPLDQALAEIEARQRALDGEAQPSRMEFARAPTQRLPELEHQLRQLNASMETWQPCGIDKAVETLRDDLAEIGATLKDAMPRQSIEVLESEVRSLAARIDDKRHAGADGLAMEGLERGLAEVRDALRALTPAENLVGFGEAVQGLSRKIDRLADIGQDPAAIKQLEGAILALRGVVSQVASDEALMRLSDEVRSLSLKVDQITASDAFFALEQRIAALAELLQSRNMPASDTANLDAAMAQLSQKIERFHSARSDLTAVSHLEDRIAQLIERLDETDARHHQFESIERGLAELLIHIDNQRAAAAERHAFESPESNGPKRDVQRSQHSVESVPAATPNPSPASDRQPIDPSLPPHHPLEPGAARGRGNSPAERIAASEAALENVRPPVIPDPDGKPNFIAAARRAAQAAMVEGLPPKDKSSAGAGLAGSAAAPLAGKGGKLRKLMVGVGLILLLLGSLHFVATRIWFAESPKPEAAARAPSSDAPSAAPASRSEPATVSPAAPDQDSALTPVPGFGFPPAPHVIGISPQNSAPANPTSGREVTGSIQPRLPAAATASAAPQAPSAGETDGDQLPAAIGSPALRAAAISGDAAAEFEIASRFAEGRGVPQNLTQAAIWFERAASKGLVPAQFRLGGLYEKGLGVRKDSEAARRLYLAAAEAGNAKAMHNLAVQFAEGGGGKPDYAAAARWFRKAADHGMVDSQYNLAILYARGIGVETNLAEAYKWFALASREGDRAAEQKRDNIAGRLDKQALQAAMAAAQTWQPQVQPEAAIQVSAPAGGWDAPPPATAKRRVGPKVENLPRRPAQ